MSTAAQLKRMGFSTEQIATATVGGKPLAECEKTTRRSDGWPGFKSKWESMYAMELADQKAAGEILEWFYEPITLKLTEATIVDGKRKRGITYTPDFVVWMPDGRLRMIEIKGYRRTKDINRYKLAKDRFRHIEFRMVKRGSGGGWVQIF